MPVLPMNQRHNSSRDQTECSSSYRPYQRSVVKICLQVLRSSADTRLTSQIILNWLPKEC